MSNKNFKGSIELISGITPMGGDFPLVDAEDIIIYDGEEDTTGVRLPDKLKTIGISADDKTQLIKDAVDATLANETFTGVKTKVDENTANINAAGTGLLDRVSVLEKDVQEGDNKELKLQFEQAESILYLFAGDKLIKPNPDDESVVPNIISQTGITGGGSGATLNYALGLSRVDQGSVVTFLHTDNPKIKFNASFTDTSVQEGEDNLVPKLLNFKLTVKLPSGAKNVYTFTGDSNTDLEYDLTTALSTTTGLILGDHDITLTVSYTQEVGEGEEAKPVTIQATKSWIVKITQMYLTSSFDDKSVKSTDIPLSVMVFGDLNKTIHYKLGEVDDWRTLEAPMSNYEYSITIPRQAHGNYPLEIYLTATVNGITVRSNSLFYDIMFAEEGNAAPIIRAVPASSKGQQYTNLAIKYSVYSPNTLISDVELAVDGKVVSTLDNVDRSEQIWNFKSNTEGMKVLTIKSGNTTRTLNIEIEKIPYAINPVTAGLELDMNPQGRTNQDADYNIFKNNVFDENGNEVPITWTLSENFDWVNGGWKTDENGDNYFCVKAGTTVDINYLLFNDPYTLVGANKAKGNGKEFKIIFKTTNVAKADTTWLSCIAAPDIGDPLGLQMDAHTGYVRSSAGSDFLSVPYSEEDKIEFDMNIVPISYNAEGGIDLTTKDIPMIMTYEDGTPVRPLVLNNDQISFKQKEAVPITIGSPYCDVHIYRMKAYSTFLSDKNILNNFIADASNADEMIDRYKRNQIYDKQNKLTPESLAEACPDMRIIKISAPRFTNDKKDKVLESTIEMIHKNGDPVLDNWVAEYAVHNGQGTSSNAYGYAGRNLELNLKNKETLRYKITRPEGVYNEDGELLVFGTIVEGKQDFWTDEALENQVEDASTVAEITTIPGTKITLGDGETVVKKVSLTRDSVPTNYFNVKVNIASSEHANNALLQKRYDRYLPYTSYAEASNPNVKNNMNFYNCVIFVQETNKDLTTHQEFNDNEWHFYSIGNIGDSKKTDDSRANDPDDKTEFCIEIMDWNRELSEFPQDTKVKANAEKYTKKDKDGNITGYTFITEDNLKAGILFERDYSLKTYQEQNNGIWQSYGYKVSTDTAIDTANLGKYYVDILEQDDYSEDYSYGFRYLNDDEDPEQIAAAKAKWNEIYRFITRDVCYDDRRADGTGKWLEDPEKVEAWKAELQDWFILDAAFYYYLFTLRYTMVDNRAKNSFWHYGKCLDGKYRVDFWDYDNDTALGIDNTGKFTMGYGVEDHDTNEGGAAHFRAHNSTFFVRVADYFADELITYYKDTLENKDATVFSSTSLINEFDAWQSEFPEELWRQQYERIYKRTYVGGYGSEWDNVVNPAQIKKAADPQFLTEMMNGKKKYQRRQFERNQDVYMSSKFFGNTVFQDVLTLRGGGDMDPNKFVVKPNGDITITPYLNMYINTGAENNAFNHHVKVNAGESVTLKYPTSALEFNYIWGASYLQSLGDLSPMYLRVAKLGQGRRMKQLILGNPTPGYNNPNLEAVEITANNKLLEELDVRNMSALGGNIPIRDVASLRKLYAQGTNYQTVQFANSGLIEEAYLPASIQSIVANNLYYLHTLELEGYNNLQSILISNCPKIAASGDDLVILEKAINLKTVRVTDVDWRIPTANVLLKLANCSGIGEDNITAIPQSVVTGKVYIENVRQSELDLFAEIWPELTITGWDNLIPQATVSFYNYDSSFLGSIKVDQGLSCPDPIATGVFALPTKPSSAQYDFQFAGWAEQVEVSPEYILDITTQQISRDVQYYAQYGKELRQYTVEWYADDKTKLHSTQVYYGEPAVYSEIPTKSAYNNIIFYLFEKWDKPTGYITGDTKVSAVWAEANGATILNNIKDGATTVDNLTPIEIYALAQYNAKEGFKTGDQISLQLGYMPTYSSDPEKERVLVEDLVLTGKNYQIFEDIELFAEDKDFVIAFDYTPAYLSTSATQTFLSCYQSGGTPKGFRVYNQNNKSILKLEPSAPTQNIHPTGHQASADTQYREIFVLRHKKGEEGLTLYRNNRYSMDPVDVVALPNPGNSNYDPWYSGKHPLVIGAEYNGGNPINIAKGTIHYAKIWFSDIGDDECRNICKWIYDTMTFDYVGADRYYYPEGSGISKASFIATDLLDQARFIFNERGEGRKQGGWKETDLRMWMNNKLFSGVSLIWQQIISKVTVASLQATESGYDNAELRKVPSYSDNYFYLPSICEVTSNPPTFSGDNIFAEELKGLNVETYPIFGNNTENNSRVKYLNGVPAFWWLRSPYYNSDSTNSTLSYWNAVVLDGRVLNSPSVQITTGTSSTTYTLSNYSSFGICPCFSI